MSIGNHTNAIILSKKATLSKFMLGGLAYAISLKIYWEMMLAMHHSIIMISSYLFIGLVLNYVAFRPVVKFHPVYNTLSNITDTKLKFIIGWPFYYLGLYLRIFIMKIL